MVASLVDLPQSVEVDEKERNQETDNQLISKTSIIE